MRESPSINSTAAFAHPNELTPLAEVLRPKQIEDIFGQDHLLAPGKPLREVIETGIPHSFILWGPPGSGKTTLARIYSESLDAQMVSLSAVRSGINDIRNAVEKGQSAKSQGRATIVFVDEVHRFNKAQQDAFLPHIECGDVVFVGATTENPSFQLTSALLSRTKVYVLKSLQTHDIRKVIDRCVGNTTDSLPERFELKPKAISIFSHSADGDARKALNFIEIAAGLAQTLDRPRVTGKMAAEIVGESMTRFDKHGDLFYEMISALHKSVRGSDPDASLYWYARMLEGGCDPLYIARRVVRIASEDIGNADPSALNLALNAWDTYQRLGTPEGELAIAQSIVYLACSPKSNAVYKAFGQAQTDAKRHGSVEVPLHLRNAPTALMKQLGYADKYRYAHDEPDGIAHNENYFPENMKAAKYYHPVDRGVEKRIKQHLDTIVRLVDRKSK